ncbi:MAG: hypothetical protein JWN08_2825 [Frankiales bacterium]|nr:hypothetical protein [Frankiales bacterium]
MDARGRLVVAVSGRAKTALWRVASRFEQEIRAYPRVYRAFYQALNASPAVRRAVGIVKSGVREDGSAAALDTELDPPRTRQQERRLAAVATRLGLPNGPA